MEEIRDALLAESLCEASNWVEPLRPVSDSSDDFCKWVCSVDYKVVND